MPDVGDLVEVIFTSVIIYFFDFTIFNICRRLTAGKLVSCTTEQLTLTRITS